MSLIWDYFAAQNWNLLCPNQTYFSAPILRSPFHLKVKAKANTKPNTKANTKANAKCNSNGNRQTKLRFRSTGPLLSMTSFASQIGFHFAFSIVQCCSSRLSFILFRLQIRSLCFSVAYCSSDSDSDSNSDSDPDQIESRRNASDLDSSGCMRLDALHQVLLVKVEIWRGFT